jgi:DNA-binding NtrC family response regulator
MARVLVVDDNMDILTLVQGVAQRMGLFAVTLSNSLQFMTAFVRFKPDIVVLDMMMPDIGGIEIVHWLADVGYGGRLVIMSGYADYERLDRALADAGGQMTVTFLRKPFRIAGLKAALGGDPAPAADCLADCAG